MLPLLPIVGLVAQVVPELLNLFGKNNEAEIAGKIADIATKVTGTTDVDQATAAINADPALAMQFKAAVLAQQTELANLAFATEKLYVEDVQDARKYRDNKVFRLGVVILLSFGTAVLLVLWGGYKILSGGVSVEPGMFAAITGFIGTLIGYIAANAQSVVNYYFGSSHGSTQKTDALESSIKAFGERK
jgi:hypothetical protein